MPGPGRRPPPAPRPRPPRPIPVTRPSPQGGGTGGGGGQAGGPPDANPELLTRGQGPEPEWIIRDFTPGMHVNPTRDAIGEQDLWWMENLQPLASGNVVPTGAFGFGPGGTAATNNGVSGVPYYITQVNLGSRLSPSAYMFFCYPDGSAWIAPCGGGAGTNIMAAGVLNTGFQQTYAVNYTGSTRLGFLVIDSNGYWDYNITAAGVLTKIGATVGTSIATYAGRVWIGNGNTLSFTDVNSYNSFAGAGGSATFSDTYLTQGITVLFATNNYLYILGAFSVDVLSNVTVSAGTTAFSRVNAVQGLGCLGVNCMTVLGFGRGLAFLDVTGYYLLAGATPERISERVQGCVRAIPNITSVNTGQLRPSAGLANLNNELCIVLQVGINDIFSDRTTQAYRYLTFIYQRHRWWCVSDQFGNSPGVYQVGPLAGVAGLSQFFGVWRIQSPNTLPTWNLTQLFSGTPNWQLRTKWWDGGKNYSEKQAINVSFSAQWKNPGPAQATGVTFQVDSELQNSSPVISIPNIPTIQIGQTNYLGGQNFATQTVKGVPAANQGYGSQYIGLTFFGVQVLSQTPVNVLEAIAMRGKQERNMLE